MEESSTAQQATDNNIMTHATHTRTHIFSSFLSLRIYNTYCYSTAAVVDAKAPQCYGMRALSALFDVMRQ